MINYKELAKKNIFNTEISVDGVKEMVYYHKYKPDLGIDVNNNNIYIYAINSLTNSWKKKPVDIIEYSNINDVKISVCRRNYGAIAGVIVNEYHLDIIINLNDGSSYQLESQSWNNFIKMIDKLLYKDVQVIDSMDVYIQILEKNILRN